MVSFRGPCRTGFGPELYSGIGNLPSTALPCPVFFFLAGTNRRVHCGDGLQQTSGLSQRNAMYMRLLRIAAQKEQQRTEDRRRAAGERPPRLGVQVQ